ncbi:radical SAM protein [Methylovulum psychrotolerans]|uniref:Heme d1 biosynthesis radical SAM protein NirJ n=1 Tax=Methylovulum psychrotolerans TaxID=1704499 RepID=A0A2S5CLV9_9GAMM|nr:radical SAM protein [Methylovulum psychrotolerans]POZ51747.1 heme d1 biosynthesis radical SAM protein NirJ [Methylovulum psychrotolerans]
MANKARPYLFYGQTQSLCEVCLAVVPAKIIFQQGNVYYQKRCLEHGVQKTLVSTDIAYFKRCKEYLKPGDMPGKFQTAIQHGCPHDCGLCPDHEQHSCLALFDIIDECNMYCPVCFANSAPGKGNPRSLEDIEKMLQTLLASEQEPDLVQVSGGEPTLHPHLLTILRRLKASPIRHLMLNTNGIRIARDPELVAGLASLMPGFEVYLQFDSLKASALQNIRGQDMRNIRIKALENLERHNISTTLVCVIRKGVNDDEIGELIQFAQQWRCVRGVTFQPVQDAGRNEMDADTAEGNRGGRITLSEIRTRIIEADNPFGDADMIPLPCHPENIAIGYGIKSAGTIVPVTGLLPREELLQGVTNTITFEKSAGLREAFLKLFSLDMCSEKTAENLNTLLCCLPRIQGGGLTYENVFRVVIIAFMDKYSFDIGSVKRSCIHFVEPDGKIYPFDTWNLFYRDKRP